MVLAIGQSRPPAAVLRPTDPRSEHWCVLGSMQRVGDDPIVQHGEGGGQGGKEAHGCRSQWESCTESLAWLAGPAEWDGMCVVTVASMHRAGVAYHHTDGGRTRALNDVGADV